MLPADFNSKPYRYSLFAALKQLELQGQLPQRVGTGQRRRDEPVEISQYAHLTFAPSDIRSFQRTASGRLRIQQYGFGLLGPNGAMPLHVSQQAHERALAKDAATVAFLDLFVHRLATLFYRAWADTEPTCGSDRPDADPFAEILYALAGVGTAGARQRDSVPDPAKARAATALGASVRSAEGLQDILTRHFGFPVRIVPFKGEWLEVSAEEQCRLGARREAACLGRGATLGSSTWQCSHRFEVQVGPLDPAAFATLLPGGPALRELADWVRLYTHDEWAWSLRLIVSHSTCDKTRLGDNGRLGWNSWLGRRVSVAEDVVLQGDHLSK